MPILGKYMLCDLGVFLKPYTLVCPDNEVGTQFTTIEEINSNTYNMSRLSHVVTTLPITNPAGVNAKICYDGALVISRNTSSVSVEMSVNILNSFLCAILLGGVHAEVINHSDLNSCDPNHDDHIFIYTSSLNNLLRLGGSSLSERIVLMHPRILTISELKSAYHHGLSVINAISNLSPFFLLNGYSAMVYQNKSDALSSLWVVVEQLTSFLWEHTFLMSPNLHPIKKNKNRLDSLKSDNRTCPTSVKLELLWQTKFISEDCFLALSLARQQRNKLVHDGNVPDFDVIQNLWGILHELLETASGINPIKMRKLTPLKAPEY